MTIPPADARKNGVPGLLEGEQEAFSPCTPQVVSALGWKTYANQKLRNYHIVIQTNQGQCKQLTYGHTMCIMGHPDW